MNFVVYIVLSSLLAFLVYEDFKHRAISAWALSVLFAVAILYSANFIVLKEIATNTLWIVLFLAVQFALLEAYYFVKRRQPKSVINEMIGIGDILFLFALTPLFSPLQYVITYIVGLLFVLISYAVIKQWIAPTIPMAGLFSVYMVLLLLVGKIIHHSWCNDEAVYDFFNRNL